jgi:hypothetical protein
MEHAFNQSAKAKQILRANFCFNMTDTPFSAAKMTSHA